MDKVGMGRDKSSYTAVSVTAEKGGAPTLFDLANAEADVEENDFPTEEEVVYAEESAYRKAA